MNAIKELYSIINQLQREKKEIEQRLNEVATDWQVMKQQLASRDAEIAELVAALEKQIAHDKAVSFERCPDCDYPQKCSRESGCHDIKNYSPIAKEALAKVRKP